MPRPMDLSGSFDLQAFNERVDELLGRGGILEMPPIPYNLGSNDTREHVIEEMVNPQIYRRRRRDIDGQFDTWEGRTNFMVFYNWLRNDVITQEIRRAYNRARGLGFRDRRDIL